MFFLLDLPAWSASKRLLHPAKNHDPRTQGLAQRGGLPPLQSPPQLLTPSQALGEEEVQQCKSTKSDSPGTQAPVFAPRIRHTTIRTRLAICHAHGELERDIGGSEWPPDQAGWQRVEMLLTTALPCCPWQSKHAWLGQGLLHPVSNIRMGWLENVLQVLQGGR